MSGRAEAALATELDLAEAKAWDALARYKFWMFGYHAGAWVKLNRIGGFKRPNPWKALVILARGHRPDPATSQSPTLFKDLAA